MLTLLCAFCDGIVSLLVLFEEEWHFVRYVPNMCHERQERLSQKAAFQTAAANAPIARARYNDVGTY